LIVERLRFDASAHPSSTPASAANESLSVPQTGEKFLRDETAIARGSGVVLLDETATVMETAKKLIDFDLRQPVARLRAAGMPRLCRRRGRRVLQHESRQLFHHGRSDRTARGVQRRAGPGWSITGDFFHSGGASLVCRFYGSLSPGPNSHFYTIDPAECQSLKDIQATTPATEKRWNFESNDFASTIPVAGQCAAGRVAVYRAYNNGFTRGIDSNHRITSNIVAYQAQIAKGWKGEGVVMCAPAT